ncbi:extracellular solute-binding protein [Aureibacillus halotolerans]|uniref:Putative aldouronate transport system substrate-binding protein n=1 Tax=Aureibacillus halotolerans TaxID=1508390 RepID=A0A4R6U7L1_9BACI|nr:extracellular solute-binding protein [Aureibacillus halotolerans]TDQ40903.1 putative aldouronate transport system substrate-binding protein [Aureibacillus halotolerans]
MKWFIKKTILVVIAAVVLVGCSNDATSGESATTDDGRVKINVFAPQGAETNFEDNKFSKVIEDKFNIDFTWQTTTLDAGAASEKRQISLASGDYPDLFLMIPWVDQFSQSELLKYGQQGIFLPLNDLIKEHAPNIQKAFDQEPDLKAMATAPDGNIYGMPQWNDCYHCSYPEKLWINTTWLDTLGLEMPTTTEEMKDVLLAFKNEDPNGNGKPDEIPMSGRVDDSPIPFLMNSFEYYHSSEIPLLLEDGNVSFAATTEGWREGVRYAAELFELGLIDPGTFTQNADALLQIGNNGGDVILGVGPGTHPGTFTTDEERLNSDKYQAIPPLEGQKNLTTYQFPSMPGATFVLTNKASEEAQIAAIKALDYMFTVEGSLNAQFGVKGVGWRDPQEGEVALNSDVDPIYRKLPENREEEEREENISWGANGQYWHFRGLRDAEVSSTEIYTTAGFERRLQEATLLYEGHEPPEENMYPYWKVWIDQEEAGEVAMLITNLNGYIEQNMVQFITGAKDIETEWEEYVSGFDGLNGSRYLEIMQKSYDALETK